MTRNKIYNELVALAKVDLITDEINDFLSENTGRPNSAGIARNQITKAPIFTLFLENIGLDEHNDI